MAWRVELAPAAERELGKIDPQHERRILMFLHERVAPPASQRGRFHVPHSSIRPLQPSIRLAALRQLPDQRAGGAGVAAQAGF